MLPLGHLAGGYLMSKIILLFSRNYPLKIKKRLLLYGALISLLPDFDFIYPLLKFGTIFTKKSVFNHHETVFHAPFFWFLISLLIFLGGVLFKKRQIKLISLIFFGSILSHLILDSFFINHGPMWLWPFSRETYGFIFPPPEDVSGFKALLLYFSHPVFYLEILFSLTVFSFLFFRNKSR
jgi:membrane-bound metal-dependent hydrolase YbcI (DUF457 family)